MKSFPDERSHALKNSKFHQLGIIRPSHGGAPDGADGEDLPIALGRQILEKASEVSAAFARVGLLHVTKEAVLLGAAELMFSFGVVAVAFKARPRYRHGKMMGRFGYHNAVGERASG